MTQNQTETLQKEQAPEIEQTYLPGKIVVHSWGYEQTNIDYYLILRRTKHYVWLQRIGATQGEATGWASGYSTPNPDLKLENYPVLRRKVLAWQGKEQGVSINSCGWASLWDGKPEHWTAYH